MKPRSSWRGLQILLERFAFTQPFMLPSTYLRKVLFACAPSLYNLPSFTVESTISFPCFHSDPPLSHKGAVLAHLDSIPPQDLVIWIDDFVLFPFGKGGSGILANCLLCGTEAIFYFRQVQIIQVCLCHSATFLLVLAAPTRLPFLFYLTLILSSSVFPFTTISLAN